MLLSLHCCGLGANGEGSRAPMSGGRALMSGGDRERTIRPGRGGDGELAAVPAVAAVAGGN
jgi:hypothetical protein